jgi:hypothetical protein
VLDLEACATDTCQLIFTAVNPVMRSSAHSLTEKSGLDCVSVGQNLQVSRVVAGILFWVLDMD